MPIQLKPYLTNADVGATLPENEAKLLASDILSSQSQMTVYPRSITPARHALFFLGRRQDQQKYLGILATDADVGAGFQGQTKPVVIEAADLHLTVAPANTANAAIMRSMLPFLSPRPLGLETSAGCGDRLGLATPGHIRAVRASGLAPILAQQSIRENSRTGRTPQQVLDDAMWGVFQEGWRAGYGADADHLKTTTDIDVCAAAGYTFYTVDPGEYVDDQAATLSETELTERLESLPWNVLESSPSDLETRLANRPIDLGEFNLTISPAEVRHAAAKYGRAVAHTVVMYRHLIEVMADRPFELEMSVDETETVTSLAEHVYVATELKRLGVEWVSLAPRYVGRFEKGVDYIGDLGQFETSLARHAAVARALGPYKLSLHSGSDKFSIYPIVARVAEELVHLKTAGTSYLEAVRAIAAIEPELFREISTFALERYPTDRATYHVSAEVEKAPSLTAASDAELPDLLDDFHLREILHVTFGSVLNHEPFREPFFDTLRSDEETYYQMLERHFERHLSPFS